MNKRMALFLSVSLLTSACLADVSFKWSTSATATYWSNYPNETPQEFTAAPKGFTVLTYLSLDTVVDFDPMVPLAETYGTVSGKDTLRAATGSTFTNRYSTANMTLGELGNGANSFVGQYAYAVLVAIPVSDFNSLYGGSVNNLPVGTRYGVSLMGAATSGGTPVALYEFTGTGKPAQSLTGGNVVADIALVPEPSSFADRKSVV